MKLHDMFDPILLQDMIGEGYIRQQVHPTLPLDILNYSEKAQFEKVWNEATRACRGLIVNRETHEIVARPFRKFFNHSEGADPTAVLQPDEPVVVTDKMDGSLGILYSTPFGHMIATRGSFTSEQAQHASVVWRERYSTVHVPEGWTVLFEIVYPQNRIVLDYGQMDDLVLLGSVNIETGRSQTASGTEDMLDWPGLVTEMFNYASLTEALAAEPRPNAEGLVVHGLVSDERIKIKYDLYVYLHRIVTGLSTRTVWEHLGEGKPLDELLEPLPEEFHPWVNQVADELEQHAFDVLVEAETAHRAILRELPEDFGRGDYARKATRLDKQLRGYLFLLLDGHTDRLQRMVWRNIKPERATLPPGMNQQTEDTA